MSDYVEVNRANWDSRVMHHVAAYDLDSFRSDSTHLSHVVQFDLPRLGSISDLDVVHLQCHIGTDTLSLAPIGSEERDRPRLLSTRTRGSHSSCG